MNKLKHNIEFTIFLVRDKAYKNELFCNHK